MLLNEEVDQNFAEKMGLRMGRFTATMPTIVSRTPLFNYIISVWDDGMKYVGDWERTLEGEEQGKGNDLPAIYAECRDIGFQSQDHANDSCADDKDSGAEEEADYDFSRCLLDTRGHRRVV